MTTCSWNKGDKKSHDDCCFSCGDEKKLVQDHVCCPFSVTSTTAPGDTLYFTESVVCGDLVATGSVTNCSEQTLTVQFVRNAGPFGGGGTVVRSLTISPNSCVTFTVGRFDTIRGFSATATADVPVDGKICIIPRYKV
jgi:hypothetical protein